VGTDINNKQVFAASFEKMADISLEKICIFSGLEKNSVTIDCCW